MHLVSFNPRAILEQKEGGQMAKHSLLCGCRKCDARRFGSSGRQRRTKSWERDEENRFGTGEEGAGGGRIYTPPVHGTTADGQEVTAAFGREGNSREGHTLLSDGHAETMDDFYGPDGDEEHDDYDGRGGGTRRGKHTGTGS
jgi:hypothetical protein